MNSNSGKRGDYISQNAFCGENDQSQYFYDASAGTLTSKGTDDTWLEVKSHNSIIYNNLPHMGEGNDAFVHNSIMDIGTNPSPTNLITNFITQGGSSSTIRTPSSSTTINKGNSRIYLTGLSIKMFEDGENSEGKIFRVEIEWDDYDVKNDVRWTGDIVLQEEVNLLTGNTITLDQNYSPVLVNRNTFTNEFSTSTFFTCRNGSSFTMQSNSYVNVENLSSFILESGSSLEVNDGAELVVKTGCTLQVLDGADLTIKGTGRIRVENGAYICIESGANINLQDSESFINLCSGYNSGVNLGTGLAGTCASISSISFSGNGMINDFSSDEILSDETYNSNETIVGKTVSAENVEINGSANVIFRG